jgi:UDP-N-acetyl-D-glucosamine dehydrogenase
MSQQKLASVAKFKNKEALIGIASAGYVGLLRM